MRPPSTHSAFTLIELSIVLVIIGLIVGGILVGRDMIEAAQIRGTIAQFEKYKTAVYTFQTKYNDMPGDMTQANAVALGFAPTSRPGDAPYVTHGNGLIEVEQATCVGTNFATCAAAIGYEGNLFWADLSSAGLMDGSFTSGTDTGGNAGYPASIAAVAKYVPLSKLGNGIYWFVYSVATSGGPGYLMPASIPPGNYFQLTAISGAGNDTGVAPLNLISPQQAYDIDSKIDDGYYNTGIVRGNNDPRFFFPLEANGEPCNGGTSGWDTANNPDTPGCTLSFFIGTP